MRKVYALSGMLVLSLLTLASLATQAQEVVGEAVLELPVQKEDKVGVERINLNPDGSFTLFSFIQQPVSKEAWVPALQIYELDSLLKVRNGKAINYAHSSGTEVREEVAGSPGAQNIKKSAASYRELLSAYPSFYRTEKKSDDFYEATQSQTGRLLIRHTRVSYAYDSLSHSFLASKKEEMFGVELGPLAGNTLQIHDAVKINKQEGLLSMVVGVKKEQDKPTSTYLRQAILLSKLKGELLGMHELSFAYPMEVRLQEYVYDANRQWKGIAYLFGPARRFGKRKTDPDPTNYQLLVLDTLGNKILHHPFQYGTRESASEPFFASAIGDTFYILGKGVGREPDYHLLIFDKEGLKKQTLINPDALYGKTLGPYEQGLQNDYSSNFVPAGAKQLPNGELIFFGEHRYTEAIGAYNPNTHAHIPARYRYAAYVFLQFDKEGNFVQNYVVPKKQLARQARMELLSATDKAFKLLVYEPCPEKAVLKNYQVFRTAKENVAIHKNYQEEAEVPLILSLNLEKKQAGTLRFAEGFVSLGQEGFFIYEPKKNWLLLAGKQLNQEGPLRVVLKKVKL